MKTTDIEKMTFMKIMKDRGSQRNERNNYTYEDDFEYEIHTGAKYYLGSSDAQFVLAYSAEGNTLIYTTELGYKFRRPENPIVIDSFKSEKDARDFLKIYSRNLKIAKIHARENYYNDGTGNPYLLDAYKFVMYKGQMFMKSAQVIPVSRVKKVSH